MKAQVCSFCNKPGHTSIHCFKKRKSHIGKDTKKVRPLKKESKTSVNKRKILRTGFFALNKPDENGKYTCYLQISPLCPKLIPKHYVTIEHVYPKNSGKYPELKYVPENILPSCEFCNKSKMSNTPEQLAIFYSNIRIMLQTKKWQLFMEKLKTAIQERNIQLYWHDEDKIFRRYSV